MTFLQPEAPYPLSRGQFVCLQTVNTSWVRNLKAFFLQDKTGSSSDFWQPWKATGDFHVSLRYFFTMWNQTLMELKPLCINYLHVDFKNHPHSGSKWHIFHILYMANDVFCSVLFCSSSAMTTMFQKPSTGSCPLQDLFLRVSILCVKDLCILSGSFCPTELIARTWWNTHIASFSWFVKDWTRISMKNIKVCLHAEKHI